MGLAERVNRQNVVQIARGAVNTFDECVRVVNEHAAVVTGLDTRTREIAESVSLLTNRVDAVGTLERRVNAQGKLVVDVEQNLQQSIANLATAGERDHAQLEQLQTEVFGRIFDHDPREFTTYTDGRRGLVGKLAATHAIASVAHTNVTRFNNLTIFGRRWWFATGKF